MQKIIMMLLMMCLTVSCKDKIICNQIKSANIKPLVLCDLSIFDKTCMCRCFDLDDYTTVEDSKCGSSFRSGAYGLEACDGIGGFSVERWSDELKPKIKKLRNLKKQYCK